MTLVKLFVYGTLRTPAGAKDSAEPDTRNHLRIANEIRSSEPALLHGAQLLSFIHYPGIVSGEATVTGELFELTEEGLEICDGIESHPDFFWRTEVSVQASISSEVTAWVYWAPDTMVDSGTPIASGDWFDRDRSVSDGRTLESALAEDRAKY